MAPRSKRALSLLRGLVAASVLALLGAAPPPEGAVAPSAALTTEEGALPSFLDGARRVGVERLGLLDAAMQQRVEVGRIGLAEVVLLAHVGVDLAAVCAADQPLVEALHGELARAPARTLRRGLARRFGRCVAAGHDRSSSRLAISMATRAASRPLSSARAQAWASFSTVRMALAIGMRWSRLIRVTPAPLSLATSSKW